MTRRRHAFFAAATILAVIVLGAWQVIAALGRVDPGTLPATLADFREGRTSAAVQRQVENALPWRGAMIVAANGLRYALFRGSADDVRVGRDGWLFLAEELRFAPDSGPAMQARIAAAAAVSDALKTRGVELVVALVPDKARVHASRLSPRDFPPQHAPRYAQALGALRAKGVTTVDLLAPLAAASREGDAYYRTDTHWNPRGARIAALAIAAAIDAKDLPRARFRTAFGPEAERPGDLVRLMGLEKAPRLLRPAFDRDRPATTVEVDGTGAALFGEFQVPVTLVGTSYAMRANFHGFLQEALGTRVLNAARDNAGFAQSLVEYLANEAFRDAPPRVIVWELPERVLSAPATSADPPPGGRFALPPR